jgi:hypothetical protein
VPTGLGRIAAMTAAGLAVLAFLATFFTSFDPGGLLPALVLGGGLTVGVAVLPTAPRTVLPGTVLSVTAALISLQTLAVSDGFDVVVVVLAVLTAAAAVVAALSALGLVAAGRTAPAGAAGAGTAPAFADRTRSGRPGPGGGSPESGPPSGSFATPGEQHTQRVGHPGGPASAGQHGAGPQASSAGGPSGPGRRPWAPMSFSSSGRPADPSGDDPSARTQVVHRSPAAGPAGADAGSPGAAGTRVDPSPSGATPAPTLAAPLADGRTAPSRGPGRDAAAGPLEPGHSEPGPLSQPGAERAGSSSATTEERQPAMSMLGGESPLERRDDGPVTPPSGERSTAGPSAPDGSGDATPPDGFPRPSGWGVPADGSEPEPGSGSGSATDGRDRPGAHEAP